MKRTVLKIASLGMLSGIALALVVACADSLRGPRPCIEVVPELVPVPLHMGRLGDGGAVIVGFENMIVVATEATVVFSLTEDLKEKGLKFQGTCAAVLPETEGRKQVYQIYLKKIAEAN